MIELLTRLYPTSWRRRYGPEFDDLVARQPVTLHLIVDLLRGALDAHWGRERDLSKMVGRIRTPGSLCLTGGAVAWLAGYWLAFPYRDPQEAAICQLGWMLVAIGQLLVTVGMIRLYAGLEPRMVRRAIVAVLAVGLNVDAGTLIWALATGNPINLAPGDPGFAHLGFMLVQYRAFAIAVPLLAAPYLCQLGYALVVRRQEQRLRPWLQAVGWVSLALLIWSQPPLALGPTDTQLLLAALPVSWLLVGLAGSLTLRQPAPEVASVRPAS